ncbi:MAG: prolyl oligopeptidase family serine peptidase [Bacillus sp. (in: Bacteria)]|nr:prolyl oligopeptidase family serine peptidase [Bacillus sp. (in: firmicutes)]
MNTIKKSDIIEDFHGTQVADPYRWLEDTTSEDSIQWGKEMALQCQNYFADTNGEEDRSRLTELWNYPKFFVPQKVKDQLFYQKNDGLQNQAVLYRKDGNEERVLIDPNTLSVDGTVAMTNYSFSGDGRYIAYATSTHGSDRQEIRVRVVASGEELGDHIQWVKFTSMAWSPDDSGFYYSRFPEPGTVSEEDEGKFNRVYFHRVGTAQEEDELIYDHPDSNEFLFHPTVSDDKKYLCLNVYFGTAAENRFYLKELGSSSEFNRLLDEQDAEYTYITNEGTTFYFLTNYEAPKGRIISIDLENADRENWKEILPQQDDVMDSVKFVNGQFVIAFLHDAHHQLHVYWLDGSHVTAIELPIIGTLTELSGKKDDKSLYFGLTSFLEPTVVYHYDMDKGKLEVFAQSVLSINTAEYETKQVFYRSKDGTNVPMFLTYRKGLELDGENPVILYGYGGFNISVTPAFNPAILRWLEKGGVYAVANLRGGSEYGEEWHKAGMLENKQNVFDDFISAGEWLVKNNYTNSGKLSIMGGSNGGLLVAACMVQRPDLFGAVICRVPVIDMLRYHKFTIGRYWIPEYGNAEKGEHFPFMYAYSPLHNIKEGEKYPPVLIATAESDDRVVPAHAKKICSHTAGKSIGRFYGGATVRGESWSRVR